jgi:hypothetical protein
MSYYRYTPKAIFENPVKVFNIYLSTRGKAGYSLRVITIDYLLTADFGKNWPDDWVPDKLV